MHLWVNGCGENGFVRGGDDQFNFGEGRRVTMDYTGNIMLCESDYGFIRRIRFQQMIP